MNQRFDPSENRNVNPAAWPADQAGPRIDPVTGAPVNDPLANQRRPEELEPRSGRSKWPVLIILLAGLVLALLVWLPAELSTDQTTGTATPPPATTDQMAPADTANAAGRYECNPGNTRYCNDSGYERDPERDAYDPGYPGAGDQHRYADPGYGALPRQPVQLRRTNICGGLIWMAELPMQLRHFLFAPRNCFQRPSN